MLLVESRHKNKRSITKRIIVKQELKTNKSDARVPNFWRFSWTFQDLDRHREFEEGQAKEIDAEEANPRVFGEAAAISQGKDFLLPRIILNLTNINFLGGGQVWKSKKRIINCKLPFF